MSLSQQPPTRRPGPCGLLTCVLATGPLLLALELPAAPALLMLARAWRAFSHSGFSCMGVSMPFSLPAPATMLYWEDLWREHTEFAALPTAWWVRWERPPPRWDHKSPLTVYCSLNFPIYDVLAPSFCCSFLCRIRTLPA